MMTVPLNFLGQQIFCLVGLMIIKVCPIYLCFAVILLIVYKVLKLFTTLCRYINIVTFSLHLTKVVEILHIWCLLAYETVTNYFNICTISSVAGRICLYWVSEPKSHVAIAGIMIALKMNSYIVITKRFN